MKRAATEMPEDRPTLEIQVNGEPQRVSAGETVAEFLEEIGFDRRAVAVERNGSIVARDRLEGVVLEPGDRLEIVRFVQGGCGCSGEAL